jgi:starch phosphorylase
MGERILNWQRDLARQWDHLRFGEVTVRTTDGQHVFETQVYLGGLNPDSVRVELYAEEVAGNGAVRQEMTRDRKLTGAGNGYLYTVAVNADRPAADYTARVIPSHEAAAVPLEAGQILWQR